MLLFCSLKIILLLQFIEYECVMDYFLKFSRFRQAGVKITLFMSCRAGRRRSDLHAIYVSRCLLYVHWQSRLGVILQVIRCKYTNFNAENRPARRVYSLTARMRLCMGIKSSAGSLPCGTPRSSSSRAACRGSAGGGG